MIKMVWKYSCISERDWCLFICCRNLDKALYIWPPEFCQACIIIHLADKIVHGHPECQGSFHGLYLLNFTLLLMHHAGLSMRWDVIFTIKYYRTGLLAPERGWHPAVRGCMWQMRWRWLAREMPLEWWTVNGSPYAQIPPYSQGTGIWTSSQRTA